MTGLEVKKKRSVLIVSTNGYQSVRLLKVIVQILEDNGLKASSFRVTAVLNRHRSNCCNCDGSDSHFELNINNFKETSRAQNKSPVIKKTNSHKNRCLLSVNSDSNSDVEKRDIYTSHKVRYATNKNFPSMNHQRDSANGNRITTTIERRRKKKSHWLAKDLTSAAKAERVTSSSQEADATKRVPRISFSPGNETDYRREIDRQIEADFAKIKDILRLEKIDVTSSAIPRWSLNAAKYNRQSVSQPTIDTQEPETITEKRVCIAPHCQQVIRHSLSSTSSDSNDLSANSDGNVTSKQNGITEEAVVSRKTVDEKMQHGTNNEKKLVGQALIFFNKDASPFTIAQKANNNDVNIKYSVESISLGLDKLVKMGKELMKKKLDNTSQNKTKRAGLSCKNCLKCAKGNNETYSGFEDDEGAKLEEELKELRSLHIQREQGFTNSAKNEMRFAAGDAYIFKNDQDTQLNNEYSQGHVRQAKRRCRRKKHKSLSTLNTSLKNSILIRNGNSRYKNMKKFSPNFCNDVQLSNTLVNGVTKTSPRIKKNNPFREYKECDAEEKLRADKKDVVYLQNKMKTSKEKHLPSENKEVRERKIQISKVSHLKFDKNSNQSNLPRKSINVRSHEVGKRNTCNEQPSSMGQSVNRSQSQMSKKNKLPQSLSNRKLKSVQPNEILHEAFPTTKNTLLRDISNYYDYDDLEMPTDSLDQAVENRNMKTNVPRRKLLYSNSLKYGEGSPGFFSKESNYDYAQKFYRDQPYEKERLQLHYFQINLKNVTQLAKARIDGEASRFESVQYHANKSMQTSSTNLKTVSKTRYIKRTLKSVAQKEYSDYMGNGDSMKNLYLSGDLIGYNYDPEESDNQEKFNRINDGNDDPDLAKLFANGQEYDINVKGKLHLRLKDPQSRVVSEKSSKKKRSARPNIKKSHKKKAAQSEGKLAVLDKRAKRNPNDNSIADVHEGDSNLESKVSNKIKGPLKKINDFFKRKFTGGSNKKKLCKKIHAKAKIIRVKPEQGEDNSHSTFSPLSDQSTTTLESRRGNCKCVHEKSTTLSSQFTTVVTDISEATDYITQSTQSHESITESNNTSYKVDSEICHSQERSTEMSTIITDVTPQYVTNQPETDYTSTNAQQVHETVSEEPPETITTTNVISTNKQTEQTTIISSNCESLESNPKQKENMKNVLEILNFIKNLEKLLKTQNNPLRVGDENGEIEIKLEKIYVHPGKNRSNAELKDALNADEKRNMSNVRSTSGVIHQLDAERPISSMPNENIQDLSNQNSKFSSNAIIKNDLDDNIFDEASQTIEKPKKYDSAIQETYVEALVPKSSKVNKKANNNKSLPAKQWTDEQRIVSDDQSSLHGRGSTSSNRKKKKRRRKKRRRRLRKRTINEALASHKKRQGALSDSMSSTSPLHKNVES
ncbi:uncharacterized protein LOC131664803 [Phymastichus coffea]|uniref:uncharacterized protein LOC131664803 n=1 Tax=Phymastichus coffea TaxID=108790 RepID=UPI00273B686A|nr:uncharacterized protein LOC131664803 [Phymastichus coffea]